MKLAFAQIVPFLNNPPETVRVFLIFGPDAGLVHDRAEKIAAKRGGNTPDPFAVTVFSGSAVGSDAAKLNDEMAALPMLGGRKIVRLHQAADTNAGAVENFIKAPCPGDSVLIIEAGELSTQSKLRKICEGKTEIAAAIPCYFEDGPQRIRTITDTLKTEGISAPRDVLTALADMLPPDRMAMERELEKLALYALNQKEISLEDVHAVIAGAGGAEMDALIEAIAGGDAGKAESLLSFLWAEQTSPVTILRSVQRYFMKLHMARHLMAETGNALAAVKQLKPPVFWKQEKPMVAQLNRWSLARLERRLTELREAEALCKKTGTPAETLCAQLLMNMAAKG